MNNYTDDAFGTTLPSESLSDSTVSPQIDKTAAKVSRLAERQAVRMERLGGLQQPVAEASEPAFTTIDQTPGFDDIDIEDVVISPDQFAHVDKYPDSVPYQERVQNVPTPIEHTWDSDSWDDYIENGTPIRNPVVEAQIAEYNRSIAERTRSVRMDPINRMGNAYTGLQSTLTRAVFLDTADLVGDITGLYDLGEREDKQAITDKLYGYDSSIADEAMEDVKERVTKIYNNYKNGEPVTLKDVVDTIWAGMNLELGVTTVGEVLPMFLGGKGIITIGKQIKKAEQAYRSGAISKDMAKQVISRIKSDASALDLAKLYTAQNAGYIATVANVTNDTIDEFKKNNNGEVSPTDVLRIASVNAIALGLDRFAGAVILEGIPGVPSARQTLSKMLPGGPDLDVKERAKIIKEGVKDLTPSQYLALAKTAKVITTSVGKVGTGILTEATQEYVQTLAEVFNVKYATEKYGSDVAEILLSDESQIEALTGSAIGAGIGGGFSATGAAIKPVSETVQSLYGMASTAIRGSQNKLTPPTTERTPVERSLENYTQSIDVRDAEEERLADKDTYGEVLARLYGERSKGLSPEKIADYVNDLETLKRTRYSLSDSPKESVEKADKILSDIETDIEAMVLNHPDGSIKFSSVLSSNSVLGSSPDIDTLPKNIREAVVSLVTQIVTKQTKEATNTTVVSKLKNMATVNDVTPEIVDKVIRSYKDVEAEASVGDRGYVGRKDRLEMMLSSGTASPIAIRKEYNEAASFYITSVDSVRNLEKGIAEAKEVAVSKNKAVNKLADSKPIPVTTEYMKADGTPFVINVRRVGNEWTAEADINEAQKRIKAKKKTITGLKDLLGTFHKDAAYYLDASRTVPLENLETLLNATEEPAKYDVDTDTDTEVDTTNDVEDVRRPTDSIEQKEESVKESTTEEQSVDRPTTEESVKEAASPVSPVLSNDKEVEAKEETADEDAYKKEQVRETKTQLAVLFLEKTSAAAGYGVRDLDTIEKDLVKAQENALALFKYENVKDLQEEVVITDVDTSDIEAMTDISEREKESMIAVRQLENTIQDAILNGVDWKITRSGEVNVNNYQKAVVETVLKDFTFSVEATGETAEFAYYEAMKMVSEVVEKIKKKDNSIANSFIEGWNEAAKRKLKGNSFIGAVNKALEKVGKVLRSKPLATDSKGTVIRARNNAVKLMKRMVGSKYGKPVFAVTGVNSEGVRETITLLNKPTKDVLNIGGKDFTIETFEEVSTNPNNYVGIKKTTVFNTLPFNDLPSVFKVSSNKFREALLNVIPPLTEQEKLVDRRGNSKERFWSAESPARTFIFDTDGKIPESVTTAMTVALHEVISMESSNLVKGPKETAAIAKMFHVADFEVTPEMRAIAENYGVLGKTMANKLGAAMMGVLGLGRLTNSNTSRGQYERLLADLGNIILEVAKDQGIIDLKSVKSSDIEALIGDNEVIEGIDLTDGGQGLAPITWFVSIDTEDTGLGVKPVTAARTVSSTYKDMKEQIANLTGEAKGPFFGQVPEEVKQKALREMRNNVAEGEIPGEAKEALEAFMETPFEVNMDSVERFFDYLEIPEYYEGIRKSMGYVSTKRVDPSDKNSDYVSSEYAEMLYEDKVVQTAINEGIERSIEHLKELYQGVKNGDVSNEMFFAFFYSTNHRYSIDSNTVNPQGDKLHRFFVVPKGHAVTYKAEKKNHTFTADVVNREGVKETRDVSLYVRAALAQGFGIGIDKENTHEIVETGNTILSIPEAQLGSVVESVLKTGKVSFNTDNGVVTFKPDHISHFLVAVEFLEKYHNSDGTFTSSLSAETDALTSGFSNKLQQFGTLDSDPDEFKTHLKRVGIVSVQDMENRLADNDGIYGINDMLSSKDTVDSYQNLALGVIEKIEGNVNDLDSSQLKMFNLVKDLLPGMDQLGNQEKVISKKLRNLFKPAFMIFNYSAGINRIVKNLSAELAESVLKDLAKADLSNKESAAYKTLAQISETLNVTPKTLQKMLRETPIEDIKISYEAINDYGEISTKKDNLLNFFSSFVIEPTYGLAVESVFKEEFAFFTEIQDNTNDAFRLAYAVFNEALEAEILKYRGSENRAVTETVFKNIVKGLKKRFPVIAGPLSSVLEEGIHVYSVDTGSPKSSMAFSNPAKTRLNGAAQSRRMQPIIKTMVAAANAGSVLPFHAIDGALLARTALKFKKDQWKGIGVPVIPVHDAMLTPLPYMDEVAYTYNETSVEVNSQYSIVDELVKMLESIEEAFDTEEYMSRIKPVDGLKIRSSVAYAERNKELSDLKKLLKDTSDLKERTKIQNDIKAFKDGSYSFGEDFNYIKNRMVMFQRKVDEGRSLVYADGTSIGAMVGLAGSTYVVGKNKPDTSFIEKLADNYTNVPVSLDGVVSVDMEHSIDYALEEKNIVAETTNESSPERVKRATRKLVKTVSKAPYTSDSVVLIDMENKTDNSNSLDVTWNKQLKEAEKALRNNAVLLFGEDALNTDDLSNPRIGEAFLYSRLMETDKYQSIQTSINDETIILVVKNTVEYEAPTVANTRESGIIAGINKDNAATNLKALEGKLKELSKRCK